MKCDKLQQKVRMSVYENYVIFALSNRVLNKLSNDTQLSKIETATFQNMRKIYVLFAIISLYFMSYFAPYLKINLNDIKYLSLRKHHKCPSRLTIKAR